MKLALAIAIVAAGLALQAWRHHKDYKTKPREE